MSRTGDTALWPGDGVAKSVATRAPPWTAKTAACPPRSPTAPARLWRPMIMTAGCTMATEWQTSFTGSRTSSQDKVGGAAPRRGSTLSYLLALLHIDAWGWWKQGAKQVCINSPFKCSLREQSSCQPMSDSYGDHRRASSIRDTSILWQFGYFWRHARVGFDQM